MYPSYPSSRKLALSLCSPSAPFLFLSITTLLSPCKAYVDWLYPPSSSSNALAYNYDVVYFAWDSNFTNPSIALWCANDDGYCKRESRFSSLSPKRSFHIHINILILNHTEASGKKSIHRKRHNQRHGPAIFPLLQRLQPHVPRVPLLPRRRRGLRARRSKPRVLAPARPRRGHADLGPFRHGFHRYTGCYRYVYVVFVIFSGGGDGGWCDKDRVRSDDGNCDGAGERRAQHGCEGGDRCWGCAGGCYGCGGAVFLCDEGAKTGKGWG